MIEKIKIFTDGSSLGNPGPGGFGVVIKRFPSQKTIELTGGEPDATNNRMEMRAMIEGLNWAKKNHKTLPIELFSDSQLLVNSLNLNWKRKKNLDLWQELDQARQGLQIKYIWLKGHDGHSENERCDQLARTAAAKISLVPVTKKPLPIQKTVPAKPPQKPKQISIF